MVCLAERGFLSPMAIHGLVLPEQQTSESKIRRKRKNTLLVLANLGGILVKGWDRNRKVVLRCLSQCMDSRLNVPCGLSQEAKDHTEHSE
jgi:hypothetical protein